MANKEGVTIHQIKRDGGLTRAYTTVATTMDRLFRKGLLDRVMIDRVFHYSRRHTPEELQRAAAAHAVRQLLSSDKSAGVPLSSLVDAISAHDPKLLDQLMEIVEHKRRELRAKT